MAIESPPHCVLAAIHLAPPRGTSLNIEDLKPRPQPRYECAGARSTRMIIESSSYQTTPSNSGPQSPKLGPFAIEDHILNDVSPKLEQLNCIDSPNHFIRAARKNHDGGDAVEDLQTNKFPTKEDSSRAGGPNNEEKYSKS
jgi:hypothetical protein